MPITEQDSPLHERTEPGDCDPRKAEELPHESPRDCEERFRQLADVLPVMIWVAGPDGTMRYLNTRMRDYCGPRMTEDSSTWAEMFVHVDCRERCAPIWIQSLQEGKPYDVQLRILHADGVYRWCLTHAAPQRDTSGRVVAWFGVTMDIHELKLTQELRGPATCVR